MISFYSWTSTAIFAQWMQTNGPYGGSIVSFAVSGTNLFAATGSGGFLSTNNGTSWTEVNTGLPNLTSSSSCRLRYESLCRNPTKAFFFPPTTAQAGLRSNTGLTDHLCQCSCRIGYESLCRD